MLPGDIQVLIQLVADLPPEVVQRRHIAALQALGILVAQAAGDGDGVAGGTAVV